ncbi:hypothetical protein PILCRDRAFT_652745 [Piloderma croceum F 1598]|uniref:Uncharacterized protein n=1 Tax=Piloderma croceum (strain F 1598) TaxID=765440 RepID=A0A0C3F8M6_PILCF|nr:hypothetical protein PILCRDRAFT_652745 [Piloderma croceum F 1598]
MGYYYWLDGCGSRIFFLEIGFFLWCCSRGMNDLRSSSPSCPMYERFSLRPLASKMIINYPVPVVGFVCEGLWFVPGTILASADFDLSSSWSPTH